MSKSKPITRAEFNKVQRLAKDALKLASSHDPDHELTLRLVRRSLRTLDQRVSITERQLERAGAPQYREVRKPSKKVRNALDV